MGKYDKSNQLLERARRVTPLGAQTYSKSYRYYCAGNSPAFIERGEGCYLYDVDGNKYIDFVCALGPITVGYNNSRVNQAVIEQLDKGIVFSQQAEVEVLLAEKITSIIPGAEMVRFVKNGSDATAAAIRLARAYTGREMVAVSGYHGMDDWYIGSTVNNKGVPKVTCDITLTFKYNDLNSLTELFEKYPDQIAAVILEPIQGNGPKEDYLNKLKELTHEHGALLVFDEVVSGFRYALGGAAELYKVTPDLVSFGKGIANGMPLSAVAGRRELLQQIEEGVFISTTFGGEALSLAGALATIEILEETGYEHIWRLGEKMRLGLVDLVEKYNLQACIEVMGLAPHCGLIFHDVGSLSYLDINTIYSHIMTEHGIITIGVNNLNLAHTEKEIDYYLEVAELVMQSVQKAVEQDSLDGIVSGCMIDPVFKRN